MTEFTHDARQRALIAYIKSEGVDATLDIKYVLELTIDDLSYIRLASKDKLLAVYRIHNDGSLRRMIRHPKVLNLESSVGTKA